MIIETRRTRLLPVSAADVDDLVRLDSDPEVMRYVSGGVATPRDEIVDWVLPRAESHLRSSRGGLWVARQRGTGRFVGWVSLRHPRHSPRPELELSYRLGRRWWGSGLATETSVAVTSMAFRTMGTQRVFATTTAANVGSRRVMEKLGMCLTWVAVPDDDSDPDLADVEYELSRAQWEFGQAPTVPFRRISTGHRPPKRVPAGRHRRAATTEFPFVATEAG